MTDAITPAAEVDGPDGPTPPDYSRLSLRELQKLCKSPTRNLPAGGKTIDLINRLKEWDHQNGRDVDLSALDEPDEPEEEVDLLDLDGPVETASAEPERPAGAGEVASASTPAGHHAGAGPTVPGDTPPAPPVPNSTVTAPSPAAPAMQMAAAPPPKLRRGQVDLTVRNGPVTDANGAVKTFRIEFACPPGELSDTQHRLFIAEAHGAAQAAGYATKGGVTIGTRVGYATDADGRRVVVYEVMLKA